MDLISRAGWRARKPEGRIALSRTSGVKVHYTGSPEDPDMLDDHRLCPMRVRRIQDGHMDGNGWDDIGYNALVCVHGKVYVGRGPLTLPAANGKGRNSAHYAVCALIGNKGITAPTPQLLTGILDAIKWLRDHGNAGNEIRGHRDGYPTDCPGDPLYAWVRAGAPRPDEQEDDVPTGYVSVGVDPKKPLPLPPGQAVDVPWPVEYSDSTEQHPAGGTRLLKGPARYALTGYLEVRGLPQGSVLTVWSVEVKGGDAKEGPECEVESRGEEITKALYPIPADTVDDGRELRLRVRHDAPKTASVAVVDGTAKAHVWR